MAVVAVTSLMRTIEIEFLQPNPRFVVENKELIICIHEKLGHLLAFLDESEKKADKRKKMRYLMTRIREVIFKAEDDIEAALLLGLDSFHNNNESENTAPSSLFPLADYPKTLDETFRNILQYIHKLLEIIINANHVVVVEDNLQLQDDGLSSVLHTNIISELEDAMVGQSTEFEEVMAHIFKTSLEERQVMAMVGMGGIGKTTFARKIYDDPRVASHFNLRGWTTVSQQHSATQMMLEICRSINAKGTDELASQLRKSLLGQRYLIIVDDIWTKKAWDEIKRCFPDENNGSRILLTTRQKEVAKYADAGEYSFNMRFLDTDESWKLFCQKLHLKEPLNKQFERVGKNIVKKGRGLPLAVVLLAGLLSTSSNKSLDEWKNVETTINSFGALDIGEQFYSRIFALSYNSLPHYLKGCFLYLGIVNEDREIPIKKLIRLWIAEGFITTLSKKRMEEIGETYLHDLINRSLVMISKQGFDGQIKTCKIHDLLHDLCVDKVKKEKLLYVHEQKDHNDWIYDPDNRWLSFRGTYSMFNSLCPSVMRVRSIFYFNTYGLILYGFNLHTNSFKRLRVLDLSDMPSVRSMPDDIVNLVFLRYLALASYELLCCLTVWRNWNLQTLVCDFSCANRPSPRIWGLPQLRHLKCHYEFPINQPEVVQENLQTLYWFDDFWCTKQVLLSIPNVKELGIYGQGNKFHPIDNLYLLNHLEKLTIRGRTYPRRPCLKLPPHAHAFPLNLKKLAIKWISIQWEDIGVVSMLPNLEILKLKDNIYMGQEWELTQEKGFPRLKVLLIYSSDFTDWKAHDDIDNPFPVLERLLLRNCDGLREMPSWIEDIHTLQLMQFGNCRQSLVNSARKIQQERQSYGDYGLVIKEIRT